jgi:hypothetical protein
MAILRVHEERRDTRGSWAAAAVLLGTLYATGCVLMNSWGGEESGPAFSHRIHVVEEELDCDMCHDYESDSGPPTMPAKGMCDLCHEGEDDEKPPEKRAEALFIDGELQAVHSSVLSDEVVFSHGAHVELADEECSVCHVGIEESDRIRPSDRITMDDCTACHEPKGVDPSCNTCHTVVDETWAPPSHASAWSRLHGQVFLARGDAVADRCSTCHSESTCAQCHAEEAPQNHNNFWRIRGHGVVASMNRDNCSTCHRSDFCVRCHENTEPLSHSGMWGSPRNNHCVGCHFPLKGDGCVTCHKSTPSHNFAPQQPPDHTPGADCRACHGFNAPLVHVDDGSNCSFCHH